MNPSPDESFATIKQRFKNVGIQSTEEIRRAYRELLFTALGCGPFVAKRNSFIDPNGMH